MSPMSPKEQIQQLLAGKPGLKAQQIATELGLEKAFVATALHDFSNTELVQDSSYRWWPRNRDAWSEANAANSTPHPLLSRLCRYYLDCLAHESGASISIPAAAADLEYVSLSALPFTHQPEIANARALLRRIEQKVHRERGLLALYIGYGVRVRPLRQRDHEEVRLEPVLLYPLEESGPSGGPLFDDGLQGRRAASRSLTSRSSRTFLPSTAATLPTKPFNFRKNSVSPPTPTKTSRHGTRSSCASSTAVPTGTGKRR